MNIFILSENPIEAAQMQCDRHIVKMTLETAQILCALHEPGVAPYKQTHFNHPCTVWARASLANYQWLCEHGIALADEYTFRYQKEHKSKNVILWCQKNTNLIDFPQKEQTPFALTMPDIFKKKSAVESYRAFYVSEKSRFAKWQKGRPPPAWMTFPA